MKKINLVLLIRFIFYEIDREMIFCDGNNLYIFEFYVC